MHLPFKLTNMSTRLMLVLVKLEVGEFQVQLPGYSTVSYLMAILGYTYKDHRVLKPLND